MEAFQPPPAVSFTTGNTAGQRRRWAKQFAFYFAAAEVNKIATKTQVAILLPCAGPVAHDIYSNFFFFANNDDDREKHLEHALKKSYEIIVNGEKTRHLKERNSGNMIGHIFSSSSISSHNCIFSLSHSLSVVNMHS